MERGLITVIMLLLCMGLVSASCGDGVCDAGERGYGSSNYCIEDCEKDGANGDYCVSVRDCSQGGDCVNNACSSAIMSAAAVLEETLCIDDSDCAVGTEVCGVEGVCQLFEDFVLEEELDFCDSDGLCESGFECVNDYCKESLGEVNIGVDDGIFYSMKMLEEGLRGSLTFNKEKKYEFKQKQVRERELELKDIRKKCSVGPSTECDRLQETVDRKISSTVESASNFVEKNKGKLSEVKKVESFEKKLVSFDEGGNRRLLKNTEIANSASNEQVRELFKTEVEKDTLRMQIKGKDVTKIAVGKNSLAETVVRSSKPGLTKGNLPSGTEVNVPSLDKPRVTKPQTITAAKAQKPTLSAEEIALKKAARVKVSSRNSDAQKAQKQPAKKTVATKKKLTDEQIAKIKAAEKKKAQRSSSSSSTTGAFVRSLLFKE